MIKAFLNLFKSKGIQARISRTHQDIAKSIAVFTDTVDKLKKSNEELAEVAGQCSLIIDSHSAVRSQAFDRQRQNDKLIQNIENLLK